MFLNNEVFEEDWFLFYLFALMLVQTHQTIKSTPQQKFQSKRDHIRNEDKTQDIKTYK